MNTIKRFFKEHPFYSIIVTILAGLIAIVLVMRVVGVVPEPWIWVDQGNITNGLSMEEGKAIFNGPDGSIYVAGDFTGEINLGGASFIAPLGGNGIYIARYGPIGPVRPVLWATAVMSPNLIGVRVEDIAVGPETLGTTPVYISGTFRGPLVFEDLSNPLNNIILLPTGTGDDGFIAKLNVTPAPVPPTFISSWAWARIVQGNFTAGADSVNALAIDNLGDVYFTGEYTGDTVSLVDSNGLTLGSRSFASAPGGVWNSDGINRAPAINNSASAFAAASTDKSVFDAFKNFFRKIFGGETASASLPTPNPIHLSCPSSVVLGSPFSCIVSLDTMPDPITGYQFVLAHDSPVGPSGTPSGTGTGMTATSVVNNYVPATFWGGGSELCPPNTLNGSNALLPTGYMRSKRYCISSDSSTAPTTAISPFVTFNFTADALGSFPVHMVTYSEGGASGGSYTIDTLGDPQNNSYVCVGANCGPSAFSASDPIVTIISPPSDTTPPTISNQHLYEANYMGGLEIPAPPTLPSCSSTSNTTTCNYTTTSPTVALTATLTDDTALNTLTVTLNGSPLLDSPFPVSGTSFNYFSPFNLPLSLGPNTIVETLFDSANNTYTFTKNITRTSSPIGPTMSYFPAYGSTLNFSGVTLAGSTGNGTITATPSGGSGGGTTTVGNFIISGADPSFFTITSPPTLTFTAGVNTPQNITMTCTSGSIVRTATLQASESVSGGSISDRTWFLACPAGIIMPPLPLQIIKSFDPVSITPGQVSTLTITIINPNNFGVTGISLMDTYPDDIVNTPIPGAAGTCQGTLTGISGDNSLTLINGVVTANNSCQIIEQVTSSIVGPHLNHTGPVTTTNAGTSSGSTATLNVISGAPLPSASNITISPVSSNLSPLNIQIGTTIDLTASPFPLGSAPFLHPINWSSLNPAASVSLTTSAVNTINGVSATAPGFPAEIRAMTCVPGIPLIGMNSRNQNTASALLAVGGGNPCSALICPDGLGGTSCMPIYGSAFVAVTSVVPPPTGTNIVVGKIKADGSFLPGGWMDVAGSVLGSNGNKGLDIAVFNTGIQNQAVLNGYTTATQEVFVTGSFSRSALFTSASNRRVVSNFINNSATVFDQNQSSSEITLTGKALSQDIFVAGYGSGFGNLSWARAFGSTAFGEVGSGISYQNGRLFFTGIVGGDATEDYPAPAPAPILYQANINTNVASAFASASADKSAWTGFKNFFSKIFSGEKASAQACPTISLLPASLSDGAVDVSYNQTITASGGIGPYSYTVTFGALPPGLFGVSQTIQGTPTTPGTYPFTITATDSGECTGSRDYSIYVPPPTTFPTLMISKLPDNQTINAGDTATFTITVTNMGPGIAENVTLHDELPASITGWTTPPTEPQLCNIVPGNVNPQALDCNFGSVTENDSRVVTVSVVTDAGHCPNMMPNTAVANGTGITTVNDSGLISCQSAPPSPTVTVNKDFFPNSGATVSVALTCTSGMVTTTPLNASEGAPAVFQVTGARVGTTCTATESVPIGYNANQVDCMTVALNGSCTITNTLSTPPITITNTLSYAGCEVSPCSPQPIPGNCTLVQPVDVTPPISVQYECDYGTISNPGLINLQIDGIINNTIGDITHYDVSAQGSANGPIELLLPECNYTPTAAAYLAIALPCASSFGPYAWDLAGGNGMYDAYENASNSNGDSVTVHKFINVLSGEICPVTITLDPVILPNGTVGQPYGSHTITASGGRVPTYGFTLGSGSPPGLSLTPPLDFSDNVQFGGTPTQAGNYTFTISATDTESPLMGAAAQLALFLAPANCTGSRQYSLSIAPAVPSGINNLGYTATTLADVFVTELNPLNGEPIWVQGIHANSVVNNPTIALADDHLSVTGNFSAPTLFIDGGDPVGYIGPTGGQTCPVDVWTGGPGSGFFSFLKKFTPKALAGALAMPGIFVADFSLDGDFQWLNLGDSSLQAFSNDISYTPIPNGSFYVTGKFSGCDLALDQSAFHIPNTEPNFFDAFFAQIKGATGGNGGGLDPILSWSTLGSTVNLDPKREGEIIDVFPAVTLTIPLGGLTTGIVSADCQVLGTATLIPNSSDQGQGTQPSGDYYFRTSMEDCIAIDLTGYGNEGPGGQVFLDKIIKKALAQAPSVFLQVPNNGQTGINKTVSITLTGLINAVLGPIPTYTLNIVSGPAGSFSGGGYIPTRSGGVSPSPGASCPVLLTKYIQLNNPENDKDQVMRLEQFLNDFEGENLRVDGYYGLLDFAAVKRFQAKYFPEVINAWEGLSRTTGYVYISTSNAINAIYCSRPIPKLFFEREGTVSAQPKTPTGEPTETEETIPTEETGFPTPGTTGGTTPGSEIPEGTVTPENLELTPEQIAQQGQGVITVPPQVPPTGETQVIPTETQKPKPTGFGAIVKSWFERFFDFLFSLFGGN